MTPSVVHLIVGPGQHGVVRFGVELQAALDAGGVVTVPHRASDAAGVLDAIPAGLGVHLQFTDRLFGADARQAVDAVRTLTAGVHRGGGRVTATLHDLPQPTDRANYAVRSQAYAALSELLDGIVVSSDHERLLLRDIGIDVPVTVVPLPIAAPAVDRSTPPAPPSVAVFGFVYPDKGHSDVLEAMRGLPPQVRMMAIGEASAGHDDLIDGLARLANAQDRPFVVTGHVPDDQVVGQLQAVTVPVVHHRHVSASGSLNSWISAGRRPLVPATRYACEMTDRNPGALNLFADEPGALSAAIRAALDDPSSTWIAPGTVCSPTPRQAADGYRRLLAEVHR
ncbi:hypothetical protein [Mycolicibacterium sp. 050158]|uniref:hypothetical protein n=1 Tax=Mycolicibacterium sp. 050158 TaxID=3090602 RepID=UPI00299D5523|nr:hypothetical protein [Mycolicibacterium sp. 050158]MDX1888718.1 hypothetical protein [Mycolicibacterium sp. 050158]